MLKIYLTIDDAPSVNFREKVDFLFKRKIPALFFCLGTQIEKDPDAIIYAAKKGFLIGNHSFSHPRFSKLPLAKALDEIERTDKLIENILQNHGMLQDRKFFRFPFGDKGDYKFGFLFKDFEEAFISGKSRFIRLAYEKLNFFTSKMLKEKHDEGVKRKDVIQGFLKKLGYGKCNFKAGCGAFAETLSDYDWTWTFDTMDWVLKEPGRGKDIQFLMDRMASDSPYDTRGVINEYRSLINARSTEIALMHDYDNNFEVFKALVIRFEQLKAVFIRP